MPNPGILPKSQAQSSKGNPQRVSRWLRDPIVRIPFPVRWRDLIKKTHERTQTYTYKHAHTHRALSRLEGLSSPPPLYTHTHTHTHTHIANTRIERKRRRTRKHTLAPYQVLTMVHTSGARGEHTRHFLRPAFNPLSPRIQRPPPPPGKLRGLAGVGVAEGSAEGGREGEGPGGRERPECGPGRSPRAARLPARRPAPPYLESTSVFGGELRADAFYSARRELGRALRPARIPGTARALQA